MAKAVKKATEQGAVVLRVARELGISGAVLNQWILKSRALERNGLGFGRSRLGRLLKQAEIVDTAGLRKKNG